MTEATEHQEQVAFVQWFEAQHPQHWIFAVPNGARVGRGHAVKLKAEGLRAGVPDLCVPSLGPLWIEMKRPKPNYRAPNKKQRAWHAHIRDLGQPVIVARGCQDAIDQVRKKMDEMTEGYLDGLDADSPEPSANRTEIYRHGFANGRDDLRGSPRAPAVALRAMGDLARIQDSAKGTI